MNKRWIAVAAAFSLSCGKASPASKAELPRLLSEMAIPHLSSRRRRSVSASS